MECPVCHQAFRPRKSTQKTCSRACRGKWVALVRQPQRTSERACGRCGRAIQARGGRLVYCDDCRNPERTCPVCGTTFHRGPKSNFCSISCRSIYASRSAPVGADHWNWKGVGNPYHNHLWHRVRDRVRARDGWRCVDCGRERPEVRLHAHHLVSRADWGDRPGHPDDADNLVTVCTGCHKKRHPRSGGTWSPKRRAAFEASKAIT